MIVSGILPWTRAAAASQAGEARQKGGVEDHQVNRNLADGILRSLILPFTCDYWASKALSSLMKPA
jgi:hypothetical protein